MESMRLDDFHVLGTDKALQTISHKALITYYTWKYDLCVSLCCLSSHANIRSTCRLEYRKLLVRAPLSKHAGTLVPSNNNRSIGFCHDYLLVPQDLRVSVLCSPISVKLTDPGSVKQTHQSVYNLITHSTAE